MLKKVNSGRDAFAFSLRGLTAVASFTLAPAVAPDRINGAISRKFAQAPGQNSSLLLWFEDFLGRYYAPGHERC